ncbi:MAG: aminotransferase class I/II-fold pyridoxal phosphate-dependent enzyme [Rhodobacteraceae bacterium]|nr:aminotransferase class I/II-fold pyridoxal phosphate-dependent enzyme [Paracoccaceae bacterium]
MQYPTRFSALPEYAFPRLRALLAPVPAGGEVLHMTIGEPKHKFPAFAMEAVAAHAEGFNKYPPNEGALELRAAIAGWVQRRYGVALDVESQILPLNGTREGLFNACLALCPEEKNGTQPLVLLPNPFYQCYMVAARAAGAEAMFINAESENGFLPDFAALGPEVLDRTAIVYMCSPSNPQGAVASATYWRSLLALAEKHDFMIFADECYSEIYRDEAPVGILQIANEVGADPSRVLAFHSLSKRSNLPGFRSGFVATSPENIRELRQLRNYTGAPIPLPIQMASAEVWADEAHVEENRNLYRAKFDLADEILGNMPGYASPEAGFFLWLKVADGEKAALDIWQKSGIRVLPGAYLSQDTPRGNPGNEYIRVALVADFDEVGRGLRAIRDVLSAAGGGEWHY